MDPCRPLRLPAAAIAAGSSPNTVSWSKSPCRSRTQCPPRRSIAGITCIIFTKTTGVPHHSNSIPAGASPQGPTHPGSGLVRPPRSQSLRSTDGPTVVADDRRVPLRFIDVFDGRKAPASPVILPRVQNDPARRSRRRGTVELSPEDRPDRSAEHNRSIAGEMGRIDEHRRVRDDSACVEDGDVSGCSTGGTDPILEFRLGTAPIAPGLEFGRQRRQEPENPDLSIRSELQQTLDPFIVTRVDVKGIRVQAFLDFRRKLPAIAGMEARNVRALIGGPVSPEETVDFMQGIGLPSKRGEQVGSDLEARAERGEQATHQGGDPGLGAAAEVPSSGIPGVTTRPASIEH